MNLRAITAVELPIPVLAEHGRIPHRVVGREPDEPAEPQIRLRQLPFRAHCIESTINAACEAHQKGLLLGHRHVLALHRFSFPRAGSERRYSKFWQRIRTTNTPPAGQQRRYTAHGKLIMSLITEREKLHETVSNAVVTVMYNNSNHVG